MLHMVGAGVYLGMSYDTFNRLRVKSRKRWIAALQDLLFWLLNVLLVFIWLQAVNSGEMRTYIFLSLLCGYAMYKALFEAAYKKLLETTINMIISIYRWTVKLIHYMIIKPIIGLYKLTIALILFLIGIIVQLGRILYSFILFLLRPFRRIFMNTWAKYKRKRKLKAEKNQQLLEAKEKEEAMEKKPKSKEGFFKRVAKWLFKK